MSNLIVCKCPSCGASLQMEINRPHIFCQYCGTKVFNQQEQMKMNVSVGQNTISGSTNLESMLATINYYTSQNNTDKAYELIEAAMLSGVLDYRIFIARAKVNLLTDKNAALFADLAQLKYLEENAADPQPITRAVSELMKFRGKNGVQVLHNATFHEIMDWVVYAVEHGADVNSIAGMNRVTPISIMFVYLDPKKTSRLDGTPFVRNKDSVKRIRRYLMQHGAKDSFRFGY